MLVYPTPGVDIVIPDIVPPAETVAVASFLAVVPKPTGFCIVTFGVVEYPTPPVDITMEDTVPAVETTAVAAAETFSVYNQI